MQGNSKACGMSVSDTLIGEVQNTQRHDKFGFRVHLACPYSVVLYLCWYNIGYNNPNIHLPAQRGLYDSRANQLFRTINKELTSKELRLSTSAVNVASTDTPKWQPQVGMWRLSAIRKLDCNCG